MSDVTIEIAGEIKDTKSFEAFVRAIVKDAPVLGWSEPVRDIANATALVTDAMNAGEKLVFAENNREDGMFVEIENVCREIGLAYLLSIDSEEEFAGSSEFWMPGMEEPRTFQGSGLSGGIVIPVTQLAEHLNSGDLGPLREIVATVALIEKTMEAGLREGTAYTADSKAEALRI